MVGLTSAATYMGAGSLLVTWHLVTLINCPPWNTSSYFLNDQTSALEQTPGPFSTCGAHTDNTTVGPLSDTLNPMTVDSWQYNTHSSINTTSSFDEKHLACYKVYVQEKMTHSIYIFSFQYPVTRLGPRKVCKPKLKLTMPNCPTRVKLGCLGGRKAPSTEKCVFFDAHLQRLKPR